MGFMGEILRCLRVRKGAPESRESCLTRKSCGRKAYILSRCILHPLTGLLAEQDSAAAPVHFLVNFLSLLQQYHGMYGGGDSTVDCLLSWGAAWSRGV